MPIAPALLRRALNRSRVAAVRKPLVDDGSWRPVWIGLSLMGLATVLVGFPSTISAVLAQTPEGLRLLLNRHGDYLAIAAFFLAALGVFLVYWVPRRNQGRPFALVTGFVGAVIAIFLGMVGYWPCAGEEATFWTSVFDTMTLFVGAAHDPFGEVGDSCAEVMPVSVQIARILALAVALGALIAVLLRLFAEQRDRLYIRFAKHLVIVTGLIEETEPFIRALAKAHDGTSRAKAWRDFPDPVVKAQVRGWIEAEQIDRAHVVVVHPNRLNPLLAGLRQAGVKLLTGNPTDLSRMGIASAPKRIRAVYAIAADSGENISVAREAYALLGKNQPPQGSAPVKILVRIDESRDAEEYRRQSMTRSTRTIIEDAFGPQQVTAQEVATLAMREQPDVLVLLGATSFATTLLDEIAQTHRERLALSSEFPKLAPPVVLIGAHTPSVAADHMFRQAWYGNSTLSVESVDEPISEAAIHSAAAQYRRPFVVDCRENEPTSALLAHRTLQLFELGHGVYHDPRIRGVESDGSLLGLHRYAPSLMQEGSIPEDRWMRAARVLHEQYVATYGTTALRQGGLPWELLSDFYRISNLRALTNVMQKVGTLEVPRVWTPQLEGQQPTPLKDIEVNQLVLPEQEDWRAYYERHGWVWGCRRVETTDQKEDPKIKRFGALPKVTPDTCPTHPNSEDCPDQPTQNQVFKQTKATVVGALKLLESLGYQPYLATPGDSTPTLAQRRGSRFLRVHDEAVAPLTYFSQPLAKSETWTFGRNSLMVSVGDCWAAESQDALERNDPKTRWPVRAVDRNRTYIQVGDNAFRRAGHVTARRAEPGEVVHTTEGSEVATENQWVIRDEYGKQWLMSADRFPKVHRGIA